MIVTLDIFSGRINPSWRLSAKQTSQVLERIESRALVDAQVPVGILGYRGLIVSSHSDDELPETLPGGFRISGQALLDSAPSGSADISLSVAETTDLTSLLLAAGEHAVDDDIMAIVRDLIEQENTQLDTSEPAEAQSEEDTEKLLGETAKACIIANTHYNPGFWNNSAIQPKNNCYNYAMNFRSDTFAQPGRISGHPNNVMDCAHVAAAANWDGCRAVCNGSNKNVALVIWPGVDYHWYRRHSEGFWGHKPGSTPARNTDNSGRVINGTTLTPANCNRGPYTSFCGYRFSPTGMRVR